MNTRTGKHMSYTRHVHTYVVSTCTGRHMSDTPCTHILCVISVSILHVHTETNPRIMRPRRVQQTQYLHAVAKTPHASRIHRRAYNYDQKTAQARTTHVTYHMRALSLYVLEPQNKNTRTNTRRNTRLAHTVYHDGKSNHTHAVNQRTLRTAPCM